VSITKNSLSIKEIAYNVGFENPHYFYTVFKHITGFTPGEYFKKKDPRP
jgi:YesN/AraC family two-component response regulator